MDPQLLRGQFALALFILLVALLILPLQDPRSGGFVVTVLAVVVALVFIGAVALIARWSTPGVPKADDKPTRTGYNGRHPGKAASALSPTVRPAPPRAKERDDV